MSAGHFADLVSRRVSVEALLQAARTIASSSRDAAFEWRWLRGEAAGSVITARECLLDVQCGPSVHDGQALVESFIAALNADGLRLIEALEQERTSPRAPAVRALAHLLAAHGGSAEMPACTGGEQPAAPCWDAPRAQ